MTKIQTKAGVPTNKRDDEEAEQRSLSGALLDGHDCDKTVDNDVELVAAETNAPCDAWNKSHEEEDAVKLAQSAFALVETIRAVSNTPERRIVRMGPLRDGKRILMTRIKTSVTDYKSDKHTH